MEVAASLRWPEGQRRVILARELALAGTPEEAARHHLASRNGCAPRPAEFVQALMDLLRQSGTCWVRVASA